MRHARLVKVGAVVCGLALLASACGSSSKKGSSSGAKEYALAYVGPLTGDSANLGVLIDDGAKVAVDQFNTAHTGKIHVTLKPFDTQGDPNIAPSQFDKYVADDSVLGLVGPAFSGETKAVLPNLEQSGLVMISASATNTALPTVVPNGKVFHRVLPDDQAQAAGIAKYLHTKLKPKTIAIIHDNSEYGKGLAVDQLSTQLGDIKVATTQVIDPKGQDFSAAVNAVKAAKPDVIFFGGYYEAAGRLKKQLADAGVTAQFISGDGSLDVGFVKAAGAAADGALLSCPCSFATPEAGGKIGAFATAYTKLNKSDPGTYSAEAYDAANILLAGIAAGNTTRPKLLSYVDGLKKVDAAISKDVTFTPTGNIESQGIFLYKVTNGKILLDTATADL